MCSGCERPAARCVILVSPSQGSQGSQLSLQHLIPPSTTLFPYPTRFTPRAPPATCHVKPPAPHHIMHVHAQYESMRALTVENNAPSLSIPAAKPSLPAAALRASTHDHLGSAPRTGGPIFAAAASQTACTTGTGSYHRIGQAAQKEMNESFRSEQPHL